MGCSRCLNVPHLLFPGLVISYQLTPWLWAQWIPSPPPAGLGSWEVSDCASAQNPVFVCNRTAISVQPLERHPTDTANGMHEHTAGLEPGIWTLETQFFPPSAILGSARQPCQDTAQASAQSACLQVLLTLTLLFCRQ